MAKQNNRKCICCSTEYRYCNTCSEDALKPSWYAIYCSENCKKLFQAVSGYLANAISIEDTKTRFDDCDLSYKDKLKDSFIKVIDEVYKNKSKEKKSVEIEIKDELKKESVEFSDVENVIEENIKMKPKYSNGKSNKKKVVFE